MQSRHRDSIRSEKMRRTGNKILMKDLKQLQDLWPRIEWFSEDLHTVEACPTRTEKQQRNRIKRKNKRKKKRFRRSAKQRLNRSLEVLSSVGPLMVCRGSWSELLGLNLI